MAYKRFDSIENIENIENILKIYWKYIENIENILKIYWKYIENIEYSLWEGAFHVSIIMLKVKFDFRLIFI